MDLSNQIVEKAASLFDAVGVNKLNDGNCLLILALESTTERDLDEFGLLDNEFHLSGFEKHVAPGLEAVLNFIRSQGFSAELMGRYGYPNKGQLNLKEAAIRAGLGRRGKSTVVLHPEYGTRLRFAAIKTDAPLEPPAVSPEAEEENPICNECSICIDACPVSALTPYHMPDTSVCLSNTANSKEEHGRLVPCDICLHLCPANHKAILTTHKQ